MQCLLRLLVSFSICAAGLFDDDSVVLTPDNPMVLTGQEFEVVCKLKENATKEQSDSMIFKLEYLEVSKEINKHVQIINSTAARLRHREYLNATQKNDQHLCCYVGNEHDCQILHILDYPVAPRLTNKSCVNDNWQSVVCSWESTSLKIKEKSYIRFGEGPVYQAQHGKDKRNHKHTVRLDGSLTNNYSLDWLYLNVTSYNKLANDTSPTVRQSLFYNLKPRAVSNVTVVELTSRGAQLNWRCPMKVWCTNLTYELHVRSQWDPPGDPPQVYGSVAGVSVTYQLMDLVPYCDYNISIRSRPLTHGFEFYSEWTTGDFHTLQDAPDGAPAVSEGGFEWQEVNDTYRRVTLYWQNIPKKLQNGPLLTHTVTEVGRQRWSTHKVSPNTSRLVLMLMNDVSYRLNVRSTNSMGTSHDTKQDVVVIPPLSKFVSPVSNLTVIGDQIPDRAGWWRVRVSWNPYPRAQYVIITWCKKYSYEYFCQDELQWKHVNSTQTSTLIQLPSLDYIFGVSIVTEDSASGIKWSECNHKIEVSDGPEVVVRDEDSSSLTVNLDKPSCGRARGYIYKYVVNYCPVTDGQSKTCTGAGTNKTIPTSLSGMMTVRLADLSPDQQYLISVYSFTHAGPSFPSRQTAKTLPQSLFPIFAGIFIPVCCILLGFAVCGACVLFKKLKRDSRECAQAMNMHIRMPSQISLAAVEDNVDYTSQAQNIPEVVIKDDQMLQERLTPLGTSASSDKHDLNQNSDLPSSLLPRVEAILFPDLQPAQRPLVSEDTGIEVATSTRSPAPGCSNTNTNPVHAVSNTTSQHATEASKSNSNPAQANTSCTLAQCDSTHPAQILINANRTSGNGCSSSKNSSHNGDKNGGTDGDYDDDDSPYEDRTVDGESKSNSDTNYTSGVIKSNGSNTESSDDYQMSTIQHMEEPRETENLLADNIQEESSDDDN